MTFGQLRSRIQEVFGEPTRSGNRSFLAKRLAWRIQSLPRVRYPQRAGAGPRNWPAMLTSAPRLPRPPKTNSVRHRTITFPHSPVIPVCP